MNEIFNDLSNNLLYSPLIGIYPAKLNLYNPFINDIAKIFFNILNNSKIEYYVFAGSSIGLLRNCQSIPWVDDYDIIIFEKDLVKLQKLLLIYEKNLFKIRKLTNSQNIIYGYVIASPRYNINKTKTSFFQLDIFISKVENNILKNTSNWGLYHLKNININLVTPPVYKIFDNIILPFFNNYQKDVEIEYGDIYNNSIIHLNHGLKKIQIKKHWSIVYDQFYALEKKSINNTINLI
jgi:phosphorylcholine metabolism protein LicD